SFELGFLQDLRQLGISTVVRQDHHYAWSRWSTRFRGCLRPTEAPGIGLVTEHVLACPGIALNRAVDQLCSKGLRFPDPPPPAVHGDGDLLVECLGNQSRHIL